MRYVWSLALLGLLACEKPAMDPNAIEVYSGPIITARHVETRYSDSSITRMVLKTPLQYEYATGDREFPEGLHIDFYNEKGEFTTTMDSRYGRYDRANDIYVGVGNVVIKNLAEEKTLETEELKWNRSTHLVYTDKFVRITTPKDLLTGTGLEAKQDFSWYRILKPTGGSKADADIL